MLTDRHWGLYNRIPNYILAHGLKDEDHVPGEVQVRPLKLLSVTLPLLLTGCTVEIFSLECSHCGIVLVECANCGNAVQLKCVHKESQRR